MRNGCFVQLEDVAIFEDLVSLERSTAGRKLLRLTLVYCDSGLSAFFTLMSALSEQRT
jgi:hypothetical protein